MVNARAIIGDGHADDSALKADADTNLRLLFAGFFKGIKGIGKNIQEHLLNLIFMH